MAVLEMLPVYLILLSPDYHVPFANRFFRERFGESHGKRCFEYLFGRTEPCEVCETYKVLKTMTPLEWRWTGPDGRNYHIFDYPFTDEAGTTLVMEVGIDITEHEQAREELRKARDGLEQRVAERTAELEAANRELEAFSYSVSHDLQAPLRALDGFSEALLEDYGAALDPTAKDYLGRIRTSSQNMGQLIDSLLRLSRVTSGELHRATVDLSEMATTIAAQLKASEPARSAIFDIAPGVTDEGDSQLLRRVLDNLLGNAWKFTVRRQPARIEFGSVVRDGKTAYFVRDNGVGFNMAYANKLFQPFQRLHSSSEFPGTGIGLAIVQRIIRRHGGSVWAEGEVDKGATFYFTLR